MKIEQLTNEQLDDLIMRVEAELARRQTESTKA